MERWQKLTKVSGLINNRPELCGVPVAGRVAAFSARTFPSPGNRGSPHRTRNARPRSCRGRASMTSTSTATQRFHRRR